MQRYQLFCLISLLFTLPGCAQESIPDPDRQIAEAVSAAPEDMREAATVYGYTNKGKLSLIREGTNSLICLSDDPNREGFQSVCYHKDLEPFMTRGRELKAAGKTNLEIFDTREAEAKAGTLKMPEQPTTLHLLEGKTGHYDAASGEVKDAQYRYVVYIPWATAESTGLPIQPVVPGGPWIMDPGTHRAHIMISTPGN
ncbi:MAG: hypothetical protein R2824_01190 [Saprospiraceae bacterium]